MNMARAIPNISDGLWEDLKVVLDYLVIKDKYLADSCETDESKHDALVYFSALHHTGSILLYSDYLTYEIFASTMVTESDEFIQECLENPILTPEKYRAAIIKKVEVDVLKDYVEKNEYYRVLIGLPPLSDTPDKYLYLDNTTYEEYGIKQITVNGITRYPAIHELDVITQGIISRTENFKKIKDSHPEAEWLNFIGENKIPLEQARNANEFEIIRLFPSMDTAITPTLVTKFSDEYNRARTWITRVMWNADLEQTSYSYRQFVGFAIMIKALRMTLNRQFDGIIENSFLNDTLVNILFDLYRLPQSLNRLPRENRRKLALELRRIIRDRASNKVLYDVARILGFDNIVISKIVLNKIQLFEGDDQEAVHARIQNVHDPLTNELVDVDDPYHSFMRQTQAIDILSPYPNDDIINQRHIKDYVREVTGPDPRWWEDNDITATDGIFPSDEEGFLRNDADEIKKKEFNPQMFKTNIFGNPNDYDIPNDDKSSYEYDDLYWSISENMRRHPSWYFPGYNSVDTKYMMLTYHYSMAEKMFEMIYLMRYLLDKKKNTEEYKVTLPIYGGKDPHSIYDIVLFLVCGLNRLMFGPLKSEYATNKYGQIINNETGYRRICGYNVDLTGKEITDYLNRCEYLDIEVIHSYLDETNLAEINDIASAYAIGILGLRDYLISKMETAVTITEWRECEKFFNMIFTYDPIRDIHGPNTIPDDPEDGYVVPAIRYTIYDMEISKFGHVIANIGDPVRITLTTNLVNISKDHTIIIGHVSSLDENGCISEINFHTPSPADEYGFLPVWNNPTYNNSDDINLISDTNFDIGDIYNPSGTNGPDIEDGSYIANVNGIDTDMYIRVTTTRFHTKDLYETYQDELLKRNPILANYISGNFTDEQMADRLNEACEILSQIVDTDLNFISGIINSGEDMEKYLIDMIKYIKSYTIDFITSEKAYILNDKRNPEWLKMHDAIVVDASKPFVYLATSPFMIYDAITGVETNTIIFDGKPFPKNEWDMDPFSKGEPRTTDRIRIYTDTDRPKVIHHYRITDLKIIKFTLPKNLKNGTYLTDRFPINDRLNPGVQYMDIEIYIGDNPTPGSDPNSYYHDSGYRYKVDNVTDNTYPIYVCFQQNNLPIHLPGDFIPDYGMQHSSMNQYFIGRVEADFTRNDLNNPQNKK